MTQACLYTQNYVIRSFLDNIFIIIIFIIIVTNYFSCFCMKAPLAVNGLEEMDVAAFSDLVSSLSGNENVQCSKYDR